MKNKSIFIILGGLIIVNALVQIYSGINDSGQIARILSPIIVLVTVLFSVTHGVLRYGKKKLFIFFLITFIVSWIYENVSIVTGFPFGHYYYTDFLGFKLLYVPLSIMPAYFGNAYLSWTLAGILLDEYKNKPIGGSIFYIPFIASFIMVMWDLGFDPSASTIAQAWVWANGGSYYGVPISNFAGWFLCVFTIYLLFALYLSKVEIHRPHPIVREKLYWIMLALMYALAAIYIPVKAIIAPDILFTALNDREWWTGDIFKANALVIFFTMFFVVSLALIKISRKNQIVIDNTTISES